MKVLVLGAGLVGGPMAIDLAKDGQFEVTSADVNPEALAKLSAYPGIETVRADLDDPQTIQFLAEGKDIVINAVPGFMGYRTVERLIECGKNVVDIAFFPEDMFGLDQKAKDNNVTVICDIGVAPGMSNVLIGYGASLLDTLGKKKGITYVGGLPVDKPGRTNTRLFFHPSTSLKNIPVRPATSMVAEW